MVDGSAAEGRASTLPIDLGFALVAVTAWVVWYRLTDGTWFFLDEWVLAGRGRSLGDLLEPYNNHLSVPYIAIYRLHMGLFGFGSYEVLRVLGITSLVAGPVLLYVTTRRTLGAAWAAVAATVLLWMEGTSLEPGAMNHWGVVAATVVAAWAARRRDPNADWWLLVALAVGFLTAGGMVACAAGVLAYCLLDGASRRRWACALVPTIGWAIWYLLLDTTTLPPELSLTRSESVERIVDGYVATLESLAFGSTLGGWLLLAGMVAVAVVRVRAGGRRALVPFAAWWGASLVWWVGLVQSRQVLADPEIYRYQRVCAVFLLLALVPVEPPPDAAPDAAPAPLSARSWQPPRALAAVGVVVLAALLAWSGLDLARRETNVLVANGRQARVLLLVATSDPPVMRPDDRMGLNMGNLSRRELQRLTQLYGPEPVPFDELDQALVDEEALFFRSIEEGATQAEGCEPVDGVPHVAERLWMVTGASEVVVTAHRFGDEPIEVDRLPANSEAELWAVRLPVDGSWTVDAPGACLAG